MTPSPDDILACETPFALFGQAVTERRALKRVYATLIKAYDPDGHPAVFAHIRALYEQARSGETGAPVRDAPALRLVRDDAIPEPDDEPPPPDVPPSEQLEEAMKEGEAERAIELLDTHDLDIRIASPGIWFASVAALADARTFALPAHTMQSWLDAIEHAPDGVPEPLLERIELLTTTGLAYQAARQDPGISPQLLNFLRHWGEGPKEVAQAFLELGEAMPDAEAAWDAHQALKDRHPALWFPYTLMANIVTREVDTFDESKSPALQAEPQDPWRTTWSRPVRSFPLLTLLVLLPVLWLPAIMAPLEPTGTTWLYAGAALGTLWGLWEYSRRRIRHVPLSHYDSVSARMVAQARAETRFPHEALDCALSERPSPPPDTLLQWQKDPTALIRVLTPAHLERIEARIAAEQAAHAHPTEQNE